MFRALEHVSREVANGTWQIAVAAFRKLFDFVWRDHSVPGRKGIARQVAVKRRGKRPGAVDGKGSLNRNVSLRNSAQLTLVLLSF